MAASSQAAADTTPAASRARRWMQFRLGTLFLLPVLLALMQRLAVNDLTSLVFLGLVLGGIFGSLWALGRMRIVGLSRAGLRRLAPVLFSAISGGAAAGMLAGPVALWWAMFRRDEQWLYVYSGATRQMTFQPWDAIYEVVTSGLYGSSAGMVVGVWGALIVGPLWAYVAFARRWGQASHDPTAVQLPEAEKKSPATGFSRLARSLIVLAFLIGLLGFPSYLAWRRWRQHCDNVMLSRLNETGLKAQAVFVDLGPRFLLRDYQFVAPRIKGWFVNFLELDVTGELDEQALVALGQVPDSIKIYFHGLESSPNDEQLQQLFETIERLQVPNRTRRLAGSSTALTYAQIHGPFANILLKGEQYTPAGLKDLLDRFSPYRIEFIYEDEAARALRGLWRNPSFAGTAQRRMLPTHSHLLFITAYRRNEISYVLPRPPPPLTPLFFRWPFY